MADKADTGSTFVLGAVTGAAVRHSDVTQSCPLSATRGAVCDTAHLHLCEVQAGKLGLGLLLVPAGLLQLLPHLSLMLSAVLTQRLQL